MALAGCSTTPATHSGDPLFGEYYPKGPNGQPMPPPTSNKATALGVPPYPASNSAASTASIAGLSGGRPLAINEKNGTNWAWPNATTPGSATPTGNHAPIVQPIPRDTTAPAGPVASVNPGAPANAVVPVNLATANPTGTVIAAGSWFTGTSASPTSTPTAPLGVVTPQVLQATLLGKGTIGLKQESVPDGVRVSCYVPQRSNPANLRYLETVARDYGAGLQALVQQIDQQP